MVEIIPSIIANTFSELSDKISRLDGLVDWAELDIMDGTFVPNISWQNENDLKDLNGKIKLSAHLMITNPEMVIEDWQQVVDRIIVHYETTDQIEMLADKFDIKEKHNPIELGLALELGTPVEEIYQFLDRIKIVQLMSVNRLGYHGEKFDERVLDKVITLHHNWPDVKIIVDGGIDLDNGRLLVEAGVSALVVGSRLWQAENLSEAIEKFKLL